MDSEYVGVACCLFAGVENLHSGRETEVGRIRFVYQPKTVYSIDPSQMLNALGSIVYRVFQKFL
jgi:hypothetical protein